jgi:hypothetical protein
MSAQITFVNGKLADFAPNITDATVAELRPGYFAIMVDFGSGTDYVDIALDAETGRFLSRLWDSYREGDRKQFGIEIANIWAEVKN